jgi:hypothetical protein
MKTSLLLSLSLSLKSFLKTSKIILLFVKMLLCWYKMLCTCWWYERTSHPLFPLDRKYSLYCCFSLS